MMPVESILELGNTHINILAAGSNVRFAGSQAHILGNIRNITGTVNGTVGVNSTHTGGVAVTFNGVVGENSATALSTVTLSAGTVRANNAIWTRNLSIAETNASLTLGTNTVGGTTTNGVLNLVNTAEVTIEGDIHAAGNGQGSVIVNSSSSSVTTIFNGKVGSDSGRPLALVNITQGSVTANDVIRTDNLSIASGSVTANNAIWTDNLSIASGSAHLTLGSKGALNLVNSTAVNVAGSIQAAAAGQGQVIVNRDAAANTVVFNGKVGLNADNPLAVVTLTRGAVRANNDIWTRGLIIVATDASLTLGTNTSGDTTTNGALNLVNTDPVTVEGNIQAAAAGQGSVIVNSSSNNVTTTFHGEMGLNGTTPLAAVTLTRGTVRANNAIWTRDLSIAGTNTSLTLGTNTSGGSTTNGALNLVNTSAVTIEGDIRAAGQGQGSVIVNSSSNSVTTTFNGKVGLEVGTPLAAVTLTRGAVRANHELSTRSLNIDGANATLMLGANGSTSGTLNLVNTSSLDVGTGTINGAAAGQGTLNVLGSANTVTFGGAIGSTNRLAAVNVGNDSTAGNAIFSADVSATHFSTGISSSAAIFRGNLTTSANTITVKNRTTLTFGGTSTQTVTGNIVAGTGNQGTVTVSNTGAPVTFNGTIGTDSTQLGTLKLISNTHTVLNNTVHVATLDLNSGSNTITVDGTARHGAVVINTSSVSNGGAVTVNIGNGVLTAEG